ILRPSLDGLAKLPGAPRWQHRLPPSEEVARAQATAGQGSSARQLGLPGELERSATDEPRLPVSWDQVRRWPVPGQVLGFDEVHSALVGLPPQKLRRIGDVARSVDDEQRVGPEVSEPG